MVEACPPRPQSRHVLVGAPRRPLLDFGLAAERYRAMPADLGRCSGYPGSCPGSRRARRSHRDRPLPVGLMSRGFRAPPHGMCTQRASYRRVCADARRSTRLACPQPLPRRWRRCVRGTRTAAREAGVSARLRGSVPASALPRLGGDAWSPHHSRAHGMDLRDFRRSGAGIRDCWRFPDALVSRGSTVRRTSCGELPYAALAAFVDTSAAGAQHRGSWPSDGGGAAAVLVPAASSSSTTRQVDLASVPSSFGFAGT